VAPPLGVSFWALGWLSLPWVEFPGCSGCWLAPEEAGVWPAELLLLLPEGLLPPLQAARDSTMHRHRSTTISLFIWWFSFHKVGSGTGRGTRARSGKPNRPGKFPLE
jgi:hypothetical protein